MADFAVTELDSEIDFSNLPYWDVVIVGAGPRDSPPVSRPPTVA